MNSTVSSNYSNAVQWYTIIFFVTPTMQKSYNKVIKVKHTITLFSYVIKHANSRYVILIYYRNTVEHRKRTRPVHTNVQVQQSIILYCHYTINMFRLYCNPFKILRKKKHNSATTRTKYRCNTYNEIVPSKTIRYLYS